MQDLVITSKGQELMAKMIAGTSTATFTKIATSSYDYSSANLEELISLYDIKQEALVSKVTRTDLTLVEVLAAINNSDLVEGYYIKGLGLYAKDSDDNEILYGISTESQKPDYMPPFAGKTVSGVSYRLNTKVDNSSQVTLEINPAALATVAQVESIQVMVNTHVTETIHGENGAHGFRFLNDVLQYWDTDTDAWIDVEPAAGAIWDAINHHTQTGDTVSIIPPNGMVAQNVQSAVDELFQFASDGKTALAGSIGDPATETDTFPTLAGKVDTAKTSLAAGLTAKGVPSTDSEPLQQLADKVAALKIDPLETVEYTILASGIFTVPADCYTYDVCLIGGGTGSVDPTYGQVNGCGGKMNTVMHVSCTPEQTIVATIGAGGQGYSATGAGGDSIFGEYVGLGGVRVTPVPAPLQMWGSANGLYVCGAGNVTMAGGGVQISTSWGYSGEKGEDGKGGGGSWGYRTDNGRASGYSGGSGRIAVRCYISK